VDDAERRNVKRTPLADADVAAASGLPFPDPCGAASAAGSRGTSMVDRNERLMSHAATSPA